MFLGLWNPSADAAIGALHLPASLLVLLALPELAACLVLTDFDPSGCRLERLAASLARSCQTHERPPLFGRMP